MSERKKKRAKPREAPTATPTSLTVSAMIGVAAAVVLALMTNILAARHFRRWDMTDDGLYTISRVTEQTLKTLPDEVTVVVLLGHADPLTLTLRHLLDAYRALTPKLRLLFIDPDRNPAEFVAAQQKYGISAGRTEDGRIVTDATVVVVRGDRHHFITSEEFTQVEEGSEQRARSRVEMVLTAALKVVVAGKAPKVCFTTGYGEAALDGGGDEGLEALDDRLRKLNYTPQSLTPVRELEGADPIDECKLVVVAGPEQRVDPADVARLVRYVENGGNALVFAGPQLDPNGKGFIDQGLAPLLALAGVKKRNDLVFERDAARTWSVGQGEALMAEPKQHPITEVFIELGGAVSIVMTLISSLDVLPEAAAKPSPLLVTSGSAFGMRDFVAWADNPVTPEPKAHDNPGPLVLASAVELPKVRADAEHGPRLVVFGTKSAIVGANWKNERLQGTGLLVESAISWLASEPIVLDIPQKPARQLGGNISEDMVSSAWLQFVVFLPAGVAAIGGVVAYRRRQSGVRRRKDDEEEDDA